ncbi:hypothetical protein Dimus_026538, partial [Dionaea muscipula]
AARSAGAALLFSFLGVVEQQQQVGDDDDGGWAGGLGFKQEKQMMVLGVVGEGNKVEDNVKLMMMKRKKRS